MTGAGARLARWALAALLLAAPAAAAPVQPPASVPPPNARAHALFEALGERPATSDVQMGFAPEQTAQMDAVIVRSFVRGETVADWRNQGVSQRALIAARPGGAAALMFERTTPFGIHRIYPGDPPIDSLIPAQWILVGRHGERGEGGVSQVEIAHISPKVIMISRIGLEPFGNASCRLRGHVLFFADPAVPASERDVIALGIHLRAQPEVDRQGVCAVFEERAPGAYASRYFDRSGRRLPQLDAGSGIHRIRPRAPFPATGGLPWAALARSGGASTFFDITNTAALPEGTEEARIFFDALAATPLDGEAPDRSIPVRLVVYGDIDATFARGAHVAGWQARGVDLRAIAAARPGGLAANIAISDGPRHTRRISFHDAPIETWVPAGWRLVARRGRAVAAPDVRVEITRLSHMLILVERVAYRREGQAWCRMRAESRIFADPAAAATYGDVGVFVPAFAALAFLDRAHLCVVMEEEAPDLYRARYFDREGHRLPVLDTPDGLFQPVPLPSNLYRIVASAPAR